MISAVPRELFRALRLVLVIAVLTGLVYPLLITGVARLVFPAQAEGSLLRDGKGNVIGSSLIGQQFSDSRYFHGRPSTTVSETDATRAAPYNAQNSGSTNLAPSNQALSDRVSASVGQIQSSEFGVPSTGVPVDLVTTSFSGLDPDISEASAMLQAERVARVRGLDPQRVANLVHSHLEGRSLGIFGEPRVNVLRLNLALDHGDAG